MRESCSNATLFYNIVYLLQTVGRNSTPDYAAGQTIRPRKRFPAFRSGSRKNTKGRPESD